MKLGATLVAGLWLTTTSVAAQTAIEQDKVTQEQDNKEASSVVITATRNEKAVDKIPGAISVISQRELEAQYQLGDDPSAALAMHVPGYAPSRQKMSSTGESLRGRAPLILFDGVPQSNPLRAGMREGYFADTAIIERIEVINGASAIQGMGATGGIINYISKTPRKEGSTHTLSMRLSTQFKDDSFNWKTGYTLAHKSGDLDLLGFVSVQARGIAYDGDGRKQGIETIQGDTMDSRGGDVFLKVGKTLDDQRVQFSF
ncbi:MAG: TonB-dependent receptor plug domain-containing protein, partial [Burkholderiales bacterium]|nr:TonB-dependent receptor plug domain-containing protein [Burkholderiales bacterium]